MSGPHETSKHHPHPTVAPPGSGPTPVKIRPATEADVPTLAGLLLRLKRLNEEFDPLLRVRPDAEQRAVEILRADLANPQALVLAVEGSGEKDRVVGIVRAHVRERMFYQPQQEGVILDIYLLPLYRRHGLGDYILEEAAGRLKSMGAGVVTAEFPTQNEIAVRFYAKRGFRPITALHARQL